MRVEFDSDWRKRATLIFLFTFYVKYKEKEENTTKQNRIFNLVDVYNEK